MQIKELLRFLKCEKVEYRALGEVFHIKNGYTPSKAKKEYWEGGSIPWFRMEDIRTNGRILKDSIQHITPKALKGGKLFPANSLIIATTATIGEHALVIVDYLSNQQFTCLSLKSELLDSINMKFMFYYGFILGQWCKENVNVSGFASVDMTKFRNFPIPLPPLSVQNAIVEILDKFTELETELRARRKQYEYYRNKLLSKEELEKRARKHLHYGESTKDSAFILSQRKSNPSPLPLPKENLSFFCIKGEPAHSPLLVKNRAGDTSAPAFSDFLHHEVSAVKTQSQIFPELVKMVSLGEMCEYSKDKISFEKLDSNNYVGVENLLQNKQGKTDSSYIPKSGFFTAFKVGDILIGNIRPYLKKIWLADIQGGTNGDVLTIRIKDDFKNLITSKFLYYHLSSEPFFIYDNKHAKGAKMPRGDKNAVMQFQIPLPPLSVQDEIVSILDKFDTLVNDLSNGIPAEIAARRKQYEYYREKLLSFERKA